MLLEIVQDIGRRKAIGYVRKYFETTGTGRPRYTGSQFETFAGGGDAHGRENIITAEDLLAVSCLAVHVRAQASIALLGPLADTVSQYLADLPSDVALGDLSESEFEKLLGRTGPAQELWDLLRQKGGIRWHIGETTATKILARKRPHLFPIVDHVVRSRTGVKRDFWRTWYQELHSNNGEASPLTSWLEDVRTKAGQPDLSLLRVLDIVLWMDGTHEGKSAPSESVD
ncbi:hypothetical protein D477_015763 [Arthrobacter crystallopoietes BAB-32]|uniref:Uncharacterized protein n=1 Tax=Arthrobacter crystallopoietes BAB-32 TaxID=1246476 RepID=N1UZM4_9MICC|nr:DUF6308 family protein [Arthrobacter crystallopoietes]EMY33262.1 hypothetical protein D477_015763 [Arthrobacter crystallopoietes BAB-32]